MNRLTTPTGDILPASEGNFVYFASFLARTVRQSTIKIDLAAVRNLHIVSGYEDPLQGRYSLEKSYGAFCVTRDPLGSGGSRLPPRVLLAIRPILKSWLGLGGISQ